MDSSYILKVDPTTLVERLVLKDKGKVEIQDGLWFGDQTPLLIFHTFSFLSTLKYLYHWNKNPTSVCLLGNTVIYIQRSAY